MAPCRWDAKDIGRFMLWNGPVSSVLDGVVFALMMLVFCPARSGGRAYHQLTDPAAQDAFVALFQTGWFVASMWTQTLVIHMVRTAKLPFVQSRASAAVHGADAVRDCSGYGAAVHPAGAGPGAYGAAARLFCSAGRCCGGICPAGQPG